MSDDTIISKRLTPATRHMGQPIALRGSDIEQFALQHSLHTSDTGLALGINTSGLYSKKNSETRLPSTISIMLRLYTVFPEHMPRIVPPDVDTVIEKITAIDPSFKKSHLGPLLGLETNSSFRFINDGIGKASQTVKNLLYIIDRIITEAPSEWFAIKAVIEIEAESRLVSPPESVWARGGWTRTLKGLPPRRGPNKKNSETSTEGTSPLEQAPPTSTAKQLIRRKKAQ